MNNRNNQYALLAEDDQPISRWLKKTLESMDQSVLVANSKVQAVKIIEQYQAKLYLAVLDVDLGDDSHGGVNLFRNYFKNQKKCKTLFISSHSAELLIKHLQGSESTLDFLEKPFDLPSFSKTVERLLQYSPPQKKLKNKMGWEFSQALYYNGDLVNLPLSHLNLISHLVKNGAADDKQLKSSLLGRRLNIEKDINFINKILQENDCGAKIEKKGIRYHAQFLIAE